MTIKQRNRGFLVNQNRPEANNNPILYYERKYEQHSRTN